MTTPAANSAHCDVRHSRIRTALSQQKLTSRPVWRRRHRFPAQTQEPPGSFQQMNPVPDHGEETYQGHDRLKGMKALITGGDSGIGRAVAIAFAREGADVAINYLEHEESDAEDTIGWIEKAGRKGVRVPGDIQDRETCEQVVAEAVKQLGGLDILVNNAGFHWDKSEPGIEHMAEEHINLAQQLGPRGIRVNGVAPGPIWTPLQPATRPEKKIETFGASTPLGRAGQPAEVAPAYVFLASPSDASYVSGTIVGVTGGESVF